MRIPSLILDPRVSVRKSGVPNTEGKCVVYWMQRAQRAVDNPALDLAIKIGNEMGMPVVVFFAPMPFYPQANLRHFSFLASGILDIAEELTRRNVGFVLRSFPDHSLIKFCDQVRAAIVIGDENPLCEAEHWRVRAAELLKIPLWTVDADVIVPSRLLGREHYAARTIRPRIHERLLEFLKPSRVVKAHAPWKEPRGLQSLPPQHDFTAGWPLDRSVSPVAGGRAEPKKPCAFSRTSSSAACGIIPETATIPNWMEPASSRLICTSATSAR
jgi:deoxyribodipyrimidine photo-lyase